MGLERHDGGRKIRARWTERAPIMNHDRSLEPYMPDQSIIGS